MLVSEGEIVNPIFCEKEEFREKNFEKRFASKIWK